MSRLLAILENLMALSSARADAASEASSSMAAANVLTEDPSEFWRSETNSPFDTYLTLYLGANQNTTIEAQALALIGHNFYRGTQARVLLDTQSPYSLEFPVQLPSSIISSSGVTSPLHTQIDDGMTPGGFAPGDFLKPTAHGTDWNVRVAMTNPASAPRTGANYQCICAFIRSTVADAPTTPADAAFAPTVKCEIFETGGGSPLANLGTKTIMSAAGQLYFWSFNAAVLATANGSALEVKLSFSGNTATHADGELDALSWVTEPFDSFETFAVYDSGWVTLAPFAGSGVTFYPEVPGQGSAWLFNFGAVKAFSRAQVLIRCDNAPPGLDFVQEIAPVPPGYVEVGTAILGEVWQPARDRDFGALIGSHDASSKSRTYGGQKFGSRRYVQRTMSLPLNWLTPEEAHTLFDRWIWRQGILKPILVSILPDDATESKHTTFLCSLKNADQLMNATTARVASRSMVLELEEEL